jgi:transglutaminase-like putative cysteine protease
MRKVPRLAIFALVVCWVFVVLYPDPRILVRSIQNIRHTDIDPVAVQSVAAALPNDPRLIEQAVLDRLVPYQYDWKVSGVPWYFPTTAEVLQAKQGDCESRAVLLASILKAKGIPFQLVMSLDHIWVQYPGKVSNTLENANVSFAQWVNGRLVIHWPTDFQLGAEINAQLDGYWTPMPLARKLLLFGGMLLLLLTNPVRMARSRRAARLLPPAGVRRLPQASPPAAPA